MKIPSQVSTTLHRLQTIGFQSAVVGGGVPRDIYHNKPIKDIDVYLPDPSEMVVSIKWDRVSSRKSAAKALVDHFDATGQPLFLPEALGYDTTTAIIQDDIMYGRNYMFQCITTDSQSHGYEYKRTAMTQIWELRNTSSMPIQFIFVKKEPTQFVIEDFDIGLCMCYYDGTKARFTPEFLEDSNNHKFTICGQSLTDVQIALAVTRHIPRLQKKYPWHTIEYAPHIQERMLQIELTP